MVELGAARLRIGRVTVGAAQVNLRGLKDFLVDSVIFR
jgi:hypothetical protein